MQFDDLPEHLHVRGLRFSLRNMHVYLRMQDLFEQRIELANLPIGHILRRNPPIRNDLSVIRVHSVRIALRGMQHVGNTVH